MSLNWNVSRIRDQSVVCWDAADTMTTMTEALIWLTMMVDLQTITRKNISEWVWRIQVLEHFDRYYLCNTINEAKPRRYNPSVADLVAHIGLATNASQSTRAQWLKKLMKAATLDADYKLRTKQPDIAKLLSEYDKGTSRGLESVDESVAGGGVPQIAAAG
jgi:hypothetical protein